MEKNSELINRSMKKEEFGVCQSNITNQGERKNSSANSNYLHDRKLSLCLTTHKN